ncbi:WD40 repeat-like protein [Choiromyces venosus 120613-1]|uniref:WD40 repeat-like protein n=1 Tax=Choiromyces venosus 120613-1 TaxID=1336337 RepID=A0A3N4K488_9PEZI|nr:WD40 repeat-like protein [Choiromyces venosus 120613-1]
MSKSATQSYITFPTGHDDLVHDVAYDYYGRRMATVSSDQRLKVFDLNDDGEWVLSESIRAHEASITRVIWGPPEHGQIIATCSYDRTVKIWEEQEMGSTLRWRRQTQLNSEKRTAIYDISFPPTTASTASGTSTGLKIAFISTDGIIHIYECREPQDLTHWIAVDVIGTLTAPPIKEIEVSFCIGFCPSRWGGEQLVVGAMDKVQVYRVGRDTVKLRPVEELKGHRGLVRDVSWAAGMGRSYHLIATGCKDGHVRIFKLTAASGHHLNPPAPLRSNGEDETNNNNNNNNNNNDVGDGWSVELIADFDDHHSDVWRVSWNATGTVLSSAGDDGTIRLWKAAFSGEFQCLSVIASQRSGYALTEVF